MGSITRDGDIWLVSILVERAPRSPHWKGGEKDILVDIEGEKSRPAVVGERNGTGRDGEGEGMGESKSTIAIV